MTNNYGSVNGFSAFSEILEQSKKGQEKLSQISKKVDKISSIASSLMSQGADIDNIIESQNFDNEGFVPNSVLEGRCATSQDDEEDDIYENYDFEITSMATPVIHQGLNDLVTGIIRSSKTQEQYEHQENTVIQMVTLWYQTEKKLWPPVMKMLQVLD